MKAGLLTWRSIWCLVRSFRVMKALVASSQDPGWSESRVPYGKLAFLSFHLETKESVSELLTQHIPFDSGSDGQSSYAQNTALAKTLPLIHLSE